MIEPVFEELARSKGQGKAEAPEGQQQVAFFVKVDLGVGISSMVACEDGVTATPMFGFFLDGMKVRACGLQSRLYAADGECLFARAQKGANALGLRTQVDILLHQACPRSLLFWSCERRVI